LKVTPGRDAKMRQAGIMYLKSGRLQCKTKVSRGGEELIGDGGIRSFRVSEARR